MKQFIYTLYYNNYLFKNLEKTISIILTFHIPLCTLIDQQYILFIQNFIRMKIHVNTTINVRATLSKR